jgi:hypothetical protein
VTPAQYEAAFLLDRLFYRDYIGWRRSIAIAHALGMKPLDYVARRVVCLRGRHV